MSHSNQSKDTSPTLSREFVAMVSDVTHNVLWNWARQNAPEEIARLIAAQDSLYQYTRFAGQEPDPVLDEQTMLAIEDCARYTSQFGARWSADAMVH